MVYKARIFNPQCKIIEILLLGVFQVFFQLSTDMGVEKESLQQGSGAKNH